VTEENQQATRAAVVPMEIGRSVRTFIAGIIVGLAIWGLAVFLEKYVFDALLCQGGDQAMRCDSAVRYAEIAATLLGAGAGLFFLIKLQVFRPLLVVLAAMAALWGILSVVQPFPPYGIALAVGGLYGAAYILFAWVSRLRLFWLVVIVLVACVAAARSILAV
jgi:hypothetical protein